MAAGGLCVLGFDFQRLVLRRIVPVLVDANFLHPRSPGFLFTI